MGKNRWAFIPAYSLPEVFPSMHFLLCGTAWRSPIMQNLCLHGWVFGIKNVRNEQKDSVSSESWHSEVAHRFRPGELCVPAQWTRALSQCRDYAAIRTQVRGCQRSRFNYGAGVARLSDTLSRARMRGPSSFAVSGLRENCAARNPNGVKVSAPHRVACGCD